MGEREFSSHWATKNLLTVNKTSDLQVFCTGKLFFGAQSFLKLFENFPNFPFTGL